MTLLYGTTVTLRPVAAHDIPVLVQILADPEVAAWWPRYDADRLHRELVTDPRIVGYAIDVDAQLVGSVQYHEEPAPDYRYATLDLFLDRSWHGKGLGTDTVRTVARHLFYDRRHHRLTVDPDTRNEKAIRTFRRVGFQPVGTMRRFARNAGGEWSDALLMDLLKVDLQ